MSDTAAPDLVALCDFKCLQGLFRGIGPNLPTVTTGRLIQGIGGAGTTSVVAIIIRGMDFTSILPGKKVLH